LHVLVGEIWVVQHGETEWSAAGRYEGVSDHPLTEAGEEQARGLTFRLNRDWDAVLSSPLSRAASTAELAGLQPLLDPDLAEWDLGPAEGRTRDEIEDPRWTPWDRPLGEPLEALAVRLRRVLQRLPEGDVLIFGHNHVLRALTALHLGLHAGAARNLLLDPARIGILTRDDPPAIRAWNL
jgi:probable phosphoglycerate mutase